MSATYVFIINAINAVRTIYTLVIFAWAILSWFNHDKGVMKDIYGFLDKLAGPVVRLFRKVIPPLGGIDFSPFLAVIVIQIFSQILIWVVQFFFAPF